MRRLSASIRTWMQLQWKERSMGYSYIFPYHLLKKRIDREGEFWRKQTEERA